MQKINQLIKHDKYVEALCEQIDPHYDVLFKHIPLYTTAKRNSKKKRLVGEIDVLAMKGESWDIYEVKCSHRILKAKKQLLRIKKVLRKENKIRNAFFFCGESGAISSVDEEKKIF